ncbi:MAG TPA: TlpA disulfide reductase family protein [Candidatus Dormibacteraeota bacterium]|jgi:peroxiredoxin|nr:TlpA disulfide reductase family protein [Candidatus Dormibacteraeota bacterium]
MPDIPGGGERPAGYLGISRRPTRRQWLRAWLFFVVGVVLLTLLFFYIRPQPSLLAVGTSAPAINLDAATGGPVHLPAAAGGEPYLLEFFGAGCAHCQQVAAQLCKEKVQVFAIDAAKESATTINAFRQQFAPGCSYPMLLDPTFIAVQAYAVTVVPTVYLVKLGRVAFAGAGLDGVSALPAAVQKATGG